MDVRGYKLMPDKKEFGSASFVTVQTRAEYVTFRLVTHKPLNASSMQSMSCLSDDDSKF